MENKLTYAEYCNSKDILIIDLHNGYSVIAIKIWNKNENKYIVNFMIKENTIDKWDMIDDAQMIAFYANHKNINSVILKFVSVNLENNYFQKYIDRYKYETYCFEVGLNYLERQNDI